MRHSVGRPAMGMGGGEIPMGRLHQAACGGRSSLFEEVMPCAP